MLRNFTLLAAATLVSGCFNDGATKNSAAADTDQQPDKRPNIVLILADDLGYSDLGVMGGEIRTPNIDALARSAVSFRQFYAAATCSPTRAMLLTGVDHHLAGLGSMGEHLADNQRGEPGFEGYLNSDVVTLPTLLQDAGYHTYMAGKWHIGGHDGSLPHDRGFEDYFALLQGGASHFSDMKRIVSIYPQTIYLENGQRISSLPDDFYSSQYYTDKTLSYIDAKKEDGKPFFAYLSFTAPHWPLQVKEEHLELYAGDYDSGYDNIRQARLERMRELGHISNNVKHVERVPTASTWDNLSETEQQQSSRSMEVYAAMVERMDVHVGRVLQYLRDNDLDDNTIVIFMSDNGAEGNDRTKIQDNETWVPANFNLSHENIGRKDSYALQQAGWGQVSSVPLRFFKGYTTEGGLRVPLFFRIPESPETVRSVEAIATVRDLVPTLLDFAGVDNHNGTYAGRDVHPISGRSLRPLLEGSVDNIHQPNEALGWELFGHRAIRKGDWKALWADGKNGADGWQLFNINNDPRETDDLSSDFPEKLAELLVDWHSYVEKNNVILPSSNMDGLH